MSTKSNPGAFRCYEAALPDEHIFTLLARDPAAPATVRFWANKRRQLGKTETPDDRDRITDACRDADLMEDWRDANLDPLGDGSGPSWKMVGISDENGGPIRVKPENVHYVPVERDGDEAVRLSVEWLLGRCKDLTDGEMSREYFADLIGLACASPARSPLARSMAKSPEPDTSDLDYLGEFGHQAVYVKKICPEVIREQMIERLRTPLPHQPVAEEPPVAESKDFLLKVRRLLELTKDEIWRGERARLWQDLWSATIRLAYPPVAESKETPGEKVVIDSEPHDLAHAPEVPPHRFSQFHKGRQYAYARGLEINPIHLPVALDAMAKDGWHLLAIFGQTDSQNIGFIFKRTLPLSFDMHIRSPEGTGRQAILDAMRNTEGLGRGLEP